MTNLNRTIHISFHFFTINTYCIHVYHDVFASFQIHMDCIVLKHEQTRDLFCIFSLFWRSSGAMTPTLMCAKIRRTYETLWAHFALTREFTRMYTFLLKERVASCKRLITCQTRVRSFSGMSMFMVREILFSPEWFLAYITLEWSFSSVNKFMSTKVKSLLELLWAKCTPV